ATPIIMSDKIFVFIDVMDAGCKCYLLSVSCAACSPCFMVSRFWLTLSTTARSASAAASGFFCFQDRANRKLFTYASYGVPACFFISDVSAGRRPVFSRYSAFAVVFVVANLIKCHAGYLFLEKLETARP